MKQPITMLKIISNGGIATFFRRKNQTGLFTFNVRIRYVSEYAIGLFVACKI